MIRILVNPFAGGRRAARVARALGEALTAVGLDGSGWAWCETHGAGDERRIAREAALAGARALVVVGGDGTLHHALHGLLEAPQPVPVAILAAGTGNDFVKNLGHDAHDPLAVARTLVRGIHRSVDIGLINGIPFLNAAGVGFDAVVAERMQYGRQSGNRRGGRARYLWHAGHTLLGYRGFDAGWGSRETLQRHLMMVFANGHTFGGSFRIAPDASVDDGALDAVVIGDIPPLERPRLLLGALQGRHVRDPRVLVHRDAAFRVPLSAPMSMECDGEVYRGETDRLEVSLHPMTLPLLR